MRNFCDYLENWCENNNNNFSLCVASGEDEKQIRIFQLFQGSLVIVVAPRIHFEREKCKLNRGREIFKEEKKMLTVVINWHSHRALAFPSYCSALSVGVLFPPRLELFARCCDEERQQGGDQIDFGTATLLSHMKYFHIFIRNRHLKSIIRFAAGAFSLWWIRFFLLPSSFS